MNAPAEPPEPPSLAAMVSAVRRGDPVDRDTLAAELARTAAQLGVPWKTIAQVRMRAGKNTRQAGSGENRSEGEA